MGKRVLSSILILAAVLMFCVPAAKADDATAGLMSQIEELKKRVEQLESQKVTGAKEGEKPAAKEASRVDLANALSKLKIKGRFVAGYLDAGKDASSYAEGSFEVPDGKVQLAFQPDDINTVVVRFNVKNAGATSFSSTNPLCDYFYLQSKDFISALKETPFSLNARLGRFKLGFGEETWSDNAVEGILPSNSAASTGATDEGLELAGKIKLDGIGLNPLGWAASITNGNKGVGSDTNDEKAVMAKLYYTVVDPLYLSVSYYDSGSMGAADKESELSIAGLTTGPAGTTDWERKAWEVNARYDFGKGKKPLDPPVYSDSKAIVRLSSGSFHDITSTGSQGERAGDFGFVDGIYNLTEKVYTAGRYSFVNLSGKDASLNGVTCNKYERYSLGLGYRWSDNTILKLAYDWNKESGPGIIDKHNNLLSAIVGTQF